MENSLRKIFDFLKANRIYNKNLQTRYYSAIVKSQNSKFEKIVSLLYDIAGTQSQPKIDYLAEFYRKIYKNKQSLDSYSGFLSLINQNENLTNDYKNLYRGMNNQKGWGQKTSALFTKTIFHLHNNDYPNELRIWNDAPNELSEEDQFYLPVDAVIIAVFKFIKNYNWTFSKVNTEIRKYYGTKEIEVWDDLWFWGFITQMGTGPSRRMQWNLNKYWALRESDKHPIAIKKIQNKAQEYLSTLNSARYKILDNKHEYF